MATVGYSGTPLAKKLGIKPEMKVLLINPPDNYIEWLETDIQKQVIRSGSADFVHLFAVKRFELEKNFTAHQKTTGQCHHLDLLV